MERNGFIKNEYGGYRETLSKKIMEDKMLDTEKVFNDFSNEIKEVIPTLDAIADKYKIYLGFSIDLLAGKFHGNIEGGGQFMLNDPRFIKNHKTTASLNDPR